MTTTNYFRLRGLKERLITSIKMLKVGAILYKRTSNIRLCFAFFMIAIVCLNPHYKSISVEIGG